MYHKLDISKPLRLIGIQLFEGTHPSIRKVLSPGWYPFIKSENDDEMGLLKDEVYPIVSPNGCPRDFYCIDKRLPRVSISAIAGKNGSGKSTLVEILYRILNNFAAILLNDRDIELAEGLEARLFFELDGVLKFIHNSKVVEYFEVENGQKRADNLNKRIGRKNYSILKRFFYTIGVNYSLYAFNPKDCIPVLEDAGKSPDTGRWIKNLFHKNDGYLFPLVLTPFRETGIIDVSKENELARQRIEVLCLLFHSQNKEFLEEYTPAKFVYRFNSKFSRDKLLYLLTNPIRPEIANSQIDLVSEFKSLWKEVLWTELRLKINPESSLRDENALFYLAYKSVKICSYYPAYRERSSFNELFAMAGPVVSKRGESMLDDDGQEKKVVTKKQVRIWLIKNRILLKDLFRIIINEPCNHITVKIHQCLDFLRNDYYVKDEDRLDIDKDLLQGRKYESYDDLMRVLPPPFFSSEVIFRELNTRKESQEGITIQSMSSGERQMLYSLSYVFYHIKNIASIKENGKRVVGYHHINLILDEAELYYHPEFQRRYVLRLLEYLAMCSINKTIIRSINILLITHSPFILSDLPETNILFLRKDNELNDGTPQKTFGANIYDLLRNGFFLDYAIGDIVQKKLQDILTLYYTLSGDEQKRAFKEKKEEFRFIVDHLGEEYLYRSFLYMYENLDEYQKGETGENRITARIQRLEDELSFLKGLISNA